MIKKKLGRNKKNRCRFCTKEGCPRPAFVDYKDVPSLKKLCTSQGKMFSRKRSGTCATYQRALSAAVKRARFMGLMPYVGE
jgi:small subunit ribosomal protein S18